jgi:Helix-turn-helix domain
LTRAETLVVLATLPVTAHLTSREAATYLNTSPAVLRVWRSTGKGPRFRGRGHFVRYTKADLDEFMRGFDHRFEGDTA